MNPIDGLAHNATVLLLQFALSLATFSPCLPPQLVLVFLFLWFFARLFLGDQLSVSHTLDPMSLIRVRQESLDERMRTRWKALFAQGNRYDWSAVSGMPPAAASVDGERVTYSNFHEWTEADTGRLEPVVSYKAIATSALRGPGFWSKPGPARSPRARPGRAGPLHNLAGRAGPGPTYCGPGPGLG